MSALAILMELSDRGIQVQPKGENSVFVSPKDKVTPDLIERIRAEKPTLIPALERIRYRAGEDWPEVAADPRQLKAFCELLMIEDMRHRGCVPPHYTAMTMCRYCGPVPIFEGFGPDVLGCPWCFNRHSGLPIPKASSNGR